MLRQLYMACAATFLVTECGIIAAEPGDKAVERKTAFRSHEVVWVSGTVLAINEKSLLMTREKKVVATFPFHDCLAVGKVHKLVSSANSYLLSDLKVGDIVTIDTIEENKQTYFVAICIWERPGGSVPAGQVVEKKMPYHEVRNADIAFRDKGTPIPEHLKEVFPPVIKLPEPKK